MLNLTDIYVSKCGTVCLVDGTPRKPWINNKGYMHIKVYGKALKVHRLVAEQYIPNPKNLPCVNHKDEDKTNNHVDNLEWCDHAYNMEYSCARNWKFIDPSGEVREIYNLSKFCRDNKLTQSSMSQLASGKLKQHKGWTKYV